MGRRLFHQSRNVEKREFVFVFIFSYEIFKRTDTVSWPALLHFSKKSFLLPPELSSFFEFSLLYLQFSSPCLSTQEDLLAFATLPRAKINLSLQNFLSTVRYLLPSCLLSIFFLKKEKKNTKTYVYIYIFFLLFLS